MLTLGVDMASQAENTAACVIEWRDGRATVADLHLTVNDELIVQLVHETETAGFDCPLGWPEPFHAFLEAFRCFQPAAGAPWDNGRRDALRFRKTDLYLRQVLGRWPLSVSTDRIGVPALRMAGLLTRLDVRDRSGDGRVYEVYPAAALHRWQLPNKGYKKKDGRVLKEVYAALRKRAGWLEVPRPFNTLLARRHDAFDALLCALCARAAAQGQTDAPPAEYANTVRVEGWAAVPADDALERLVES